MKPIDSINHISTQIGILGIFFLFAFGMSGCVRSISSSVNPTLPGSDSISRTPTIEQLYTQEISPTFPSTVFSSTTPPEATPAPTLEDSQTLADFPLAVSNSWVYQYRASTGTQEATWRIADTVIEEQMVSPYHVFKVVREVTLVEGDPAGYFMGVPISETYWYGIYGREVYRLGDPPVWSDLSQARLEFVFPLTDQACWIPDPVQRALAGANDSTGCRTANGPVSVKVSAGSFSDCYPLVTKSEAGVTTLTFCNRVGMVEEDFQSTGQESGYHFELMAYLLQ